MSRFEIVRTDADQPWHARFMASNGRIVWTTETYHRRKAALNAISALIDAFGGCWIDDRWHYGTKRGFGPAVVYRRDSWNKTNGLRTEIRDVDERGQR